MANVADIIKQISPIPTQKGVNQHAHGLVLGVEPYRKVLEVQRT